MTGGVINLGDITIIDMNMFNNRSLKKRSKTDRKKETDKSLILTGDFNNSVQKP